MIDMLHCLMLTHEKVINLLYEELLNGKAKNAVNGKLRGGTKKKKVVGDAAVGQQVAELFVNELGLPERRCRCVHQRNARRTAQRGV